ncbi:MAG: PH domain-containing protein [Brevibacterium sp.]|uniref:PH domain-containing protein n=1 Tax=Brevibacterium sp. TaxID=1701 RepID=UPI00264713B3|nr:PH domain-containing protein [Brevibacterium sp.]MDN5806997.1 PH domain-containing protein [Brevibacterium sp.]MDN5832947.1 PH domain-containing protein [Brevibacterium sp.]MDN5875270.1 PH domain-containing protein [Brevibacterium sp.]MDN5908367.1 PH domain-containing protein [Brevibacterium sp.]MDN6123139.1 PH domain-containing protein [Brevibacterium sp.]
MFGALTDPKVENHLISEEGEVVVDEVRRHFLAFVAPSLIILLGLAVAALSFTVPVDFASIPLGIGAAIALFGVYRALFVQMDRFVITNMRVFRIHGIFTQHKATMPMARILDISVHKPLMGRIFRYGHFVFESAAQDQGLRDIRYVGRPDERDLTIQTVIQRSGLRSAIKSFNDKNTDDSADTPDTNLETAVGLQADAAGDSDTGHADCYEPEAGYDPNMNPAVVDSRHRFSAGTSTGEYPAVRTGVGPNVDTEEWNTMELNTGHGFTDSEEIRIGSATPALNDPVALAASAWELRWPERSRMQTATELMRAHRLLINDLDGRLRPLGLTYARYEALLLLFFDQRGALPLVELTDHLQVEASSSFSTVRWLEDNDLLRRVLEPGEDGEVVAEITPKGRALTDRASQIVAEARFGLGSMSDAECHQLTDLLARQRRIRG